MKKEYKTPTIEFIPIEEATMLMTSRPYDPDRLEVYNRYSNDEQLSKEFNIFDEDPDFQFEWEF